MKISDGHPYHFHVGGTPMGRLAVCMLCVWYMCAVHACPVFRSYYVFWGGMLALCLGAFCVFSGGMLCVSVGAGWLQGESYYVTWCGFAVWLLCVYCVSLRA